MQLFILILLLWVGMGCVQGSSDLSALSEFKKGIQEDLSNPLTESWTSNNAPESDGCPFKWYGVQCDGGHVISITLNDLGLVGNVDFSLLAGMQMLQNLSISNNRLTGSLPPQLGSIKSLQLLDLSRNSFSGSIPSELMKMENLVHLNLSSNGFDGNIPSGFSSLKKLKYLDLHSNGFSGSISFLAELLNVVTVDLSNNKFSGSLDALLNNSSFVSSVVYLNISNNGLSGRLFAQDPFPLFDSLEVLDARQNQLTGQVPSFRSVVSLRILHLGNNNFSGSLPEDLFNEHSMVLSELDLSNNKLEGQIGSITSTTLKNLNLSGNRLSGSLPMKVGSCSIVDLSNNMLSGNLSNIQGWGNYVEVIHLSSNLLTGTLPNETSPFLRLSSLKVSKNSLMGKLPLVIGTYPELNTIDFSSNQLHGSLPASLFTAFRLTDLNLSGNSFSGPIPLPDSKRGVAISSDTPLFAQNSSLQSLDLSRNLLNGSLPQGIGILKGLKRLNIGQNNISGQIPDEIGLLHSMSYLDMSNNNLQGIIPDNMPDSLVNFNVSYNNLTGTVPESLKKFPESSFHPGNSMLVIPHWPSDTNGSSGSKKHLFGMKSLIKTLIIVGIIGTVAVIILLSVLIYCRISAGIIRRRKTGTPLPNDHGDTVVENSVSTEPGTVKAVAKSVQLPHVTSSSLPENEGKATISLFSSSPISGVPCSFAHPPILIVGSPDKMAGDLHLFDNSYIFTSEELSRAPAEIIGRSCHGTSYKATLDSEHVIIVKWLREGISKGKKEFAREAKKLGSIKHPNIVSLRGYYWGPKEHERLIISEYINAVSLTSHLCEYEQRNLQPLSLAQRLSVAVDVACSLNYLHNERAIPHGNLKSSNVILQLPNLNALLTDYSLHRIMNPAGMAEQVLNAGALGYRPPEFANTSKPCPSLKSDVYAFGVILLELLTGKNAGEIVSSNPGVVDLTDWVKLLASENRSYECFDQIIPGVDSAEETPKALEDMLGVALRCIRSAPDRPEIRTVFEDLSSIEQ